MQERIREKSSDSVLSTDISINNRVIDEYIERMYTRNIFGNFFFHFITNNNIAPMASSLMIFIVSGILSTLITIAFSYNHYTKIWGKDNLYSSMASFMVSIYQIDSDTHPSHVFYSIPFIISIIMTLCSISAYVGFTVYYNRKFFGVSFQIFFITYCHGCVPFFLIYSCYISFSSIVLYSESKSDQRLAYLIIPLLAVINLPSHVVCLIKSLVDSAIAPLPITPISLVSFFKWYFGLIINGILVISLRQISDDSVFPLFSIIFVILYSISVIYMLINEPVTYLFKSRLFSLFIYFILFFNSIIAFIHYFIKENQYTFISFGFVVFVDVLSPFISYFCIKRKSQLVTNLIMSKRVIREDTFTLKEFIEGFATRSSPKLADTYLIKSLMNKYQDNHGLFLIMLHYLLFYEESPEFIIAEATELVKITFDDFLLTYQLINLINCTYEHISSSQKSISIVQKRLDEVINNCRQAQADFWNVVANDYEEIIDSYASRLFHAICIANSFFVQLGVGNLMNEKILYEYHNFLLNIAIDYEPLKDITIDSEPSTSISFTDELVSHPKKKSKSCRRSMSNIRVSRSEDLDELRSSAEFSIPKEKLRLYDRTKHYLPPKELLRWSLVILFFSCSIIIVISEVCDAIYLLNLGLVAKPRFYRLVHFEYDYYNVIGMSFFHHINLICPENSTLQVISNKTFLHSEIQGIRHHEYLKSTIAYKYLNFTEFNNFLDLMGVFIDEKYDTLADLVESPTLYELSEYLLKNYNDIQRLFFNAKKYSKQHSYEISQCNIYTLVVLSVCNTVLIIVLAVVIFSYLDICKWLFALPLSLPKQTVALIYKFFRIKNKNVRFFDKASYKKKFGIRLFIYSVLIMAFQYAFFEWCYSVIVGIDLISFEYLNSLSSLPFTTISMYFSSQMYTGHKSYPIYLQSIAEIFLKLSSDIPAHEYVHSKKLYPNPYMPAAQNINHQLIFDKKDSSIINQIVYMLQEIGIHLLEIVEISYSNALTLDMINFRLMTELSIPTQSYVSEVESIVNWTYTNSIISVVILLIVFLFIECGLMILWIRAVLEMKNIFNLIIKLITLMPKDSPFVVNGHLDFTARPKIDTESVLKIMPIGLVTFNKDGTVCYMNEYMSTYFEGIRHYGVDNIDLSHMTLGDGTEKKFTVSPKQRINKFPKLPFEKNLPGSYFVHLFDVSSTKMKQAQLEMIENETTSFKNQIFPPNMPKGKSNYEQTMFFLKWFALIEIELPEDISEATFFKISEKIDTMVEQLVTLFYIIHQRSSIFIVFSSFNVRSHQRQYLRDTLRCSQYLYDLILVNEETHDSKIAITQGSRGICRFVNSPIPYVILYMRETLFSGKVLRLANPGEMIVEYDLIKSVTDVSPRFDRIETQVIDEVEIEYGVITEKITFTDGFSNYIQPK